MDISRGALDGFYFLLDPAKYSRARISAQQWETYRKYFYNILTKSFNDEELRDLCWQLGLDYHNLPATTKDGKARELIDYVGRHDLIYKLVDVGQSLRPNINWEPS